MIHTKSPKIDCLPMAKLRVLIWEAESKTYPCRASLETASHIARFMLYDHPMGCRSHIAVVPECLDVSISVILEYNRQVVHSDSG